MSRAKTSAAATATKQRARGANQHPVPEYDADLLHILPVSLLETHADYVAEFLAIARELDKPLGWHYLLDLAWTAAEVESSVAENATVLDAGAGTGLMQLWLADHGRGVISVDRMPRYFPAKLRNWCSIVEYASGRPGPTINEACRSVARAVREKRYVARSMACLAATARDRLLYRLEPRAAGTIRILEADLLDLTEIPSESVDAVVSISSLEHNSPENLVRVLAELLRVLKPGGRIIATLGAAKDRDWYHHPSSGWCYTEASLRDAFGLNEACPSNYDDYDALFESLKGCGFLRENLSEFYFHAGNNGMPWGIWNPLYQSVGVIKTKG
jgi:SAM-dependent methyltransferase